MTRRGSSTEAVPASTRLDLEPILDALAQLIAAKITHAGETIPAQRLLTIEQAAKYLGRTKDAVEHMVHGRKFPTVRSDRRVFIDILDLDKWIQENKAYGI